MPFLSCRLSHLSNFVHRQHSDGSWDSICLICHLTVVARANVMSEAELSASDVLHKCGTSNQDRRDSGTHPDSGGGMISNRERETRSQWAMCGLLRLRSFQRRMSGCAREAKLMLIESMGVVNTGDAGREMTAKNDVWV